ncbi:MAG: DNA repair protein rad50 [Geoglossum umbratile]|nr:MAG: DNA repair protein rad50 [Geoglossum umbratile]
MLYRVKGTRAKIDKLSILGVRSFDNTRSETIQFHSPLTLIVGYNGSGKTTIIECLKYATTGDLPPNSRGGAFIHDPKLCGEKEVLAQVKLSFKGTSGAKMVCTRSLQLTVKKTVRQQKTLEGQLLMVKDGERTAISSRVAELDQIMPQYLGVSKAILDSVVFCHQDESLWPMSEPGVLKKKFDEIFEALKYTKAIDNIKVLKKKQNEELAKYKIFEQQYKTDKDRADRAEKKSKELHDEIEGLRAECQDLARQIAETVAESDKLWKQTKAFEEIIGSLNGKRIEARARQESIEDLRNHITEMEESDEWLLSTLEQYEDRMSVYREHIRSQTKRYEELRSEIEDARRRLGEKQTEEGKYEAEKGHHERQIARREDLIKETARRHNIRGFDGELDEMQIHEVMERIGKMSRDQNLSLERVRRETREELQETQSVLNKLGEKRSALNQSKSYAKQEIVANDKKASEIQAELGSIDVDEGQVAVLESTLSEASGRLQRYKTDFGEASWDKRIHDANAELRSVESSSEDLNAELIRSTRQAGNLARLQFLKKEVKDRQHGLETLSTTYSGKISDVVGAEWRPTTLDKDFQSAVEQKEEEVAEAIRQRDGMSRELEQVEFKVNTARASLKKKRQEMLDCERRVREAIDNEPVASYPEFVTQLEDSRDIRKADVDSFKNMRDYYGSCLNTANENSICRLCERKFQFEKEKTRFTSKLQKLLSEAAQEDLKLELLAFEEDLKKAREAGPSYDTHQRLSNVEIPELEAEVKRLEKRRNDLINRVEEQEKVLSERQAAKKEVEVLAKTVQNISRYHSEIIGFEDQIRDLSEKQKDAGLSQTLEDIQEQLETLAEKARLMKSSIAKLTSDRDSGRARINQSELELRDADTKLSNASHQLKAKSGLLARIEEFKVANRKQREAMKQADDDLQNLAPQVSQAQAQYNGISQRGAEKERELQQEASRLADSVHQLKITEDDINSYIDRQGPNQLAHCRQEVLGLQEEISRHEEEQRQIAVEINKTKGMLGENEETKRSISDNLRYRRDIRALDSVNAEIASLEAQNAETDREEFQREAKKLDMRHTRLTAEHASKMGVMKSKDDQLMQLLNDWNTDYKDAAQKFKEMHIKVETTKAAVEDLGRYANALDKAIMKFHSLKMEEINHIVEELWKRTYQGTDVDTILIRSDNETARGNRSYNYRVCMVKQDAEMDMRGRCSAGQKVLASIIIRLALAECFGVNCGLIALDEPTTNLDRDNIRSLAESLHDIIKTRQQQSNFQLIVITHDEDFLRYMKCADFCDNYYRVSRNDRQKSIIERYVS